ncbi:hypothetical protein [Mucilaginibacter aquatilis]|uniref:Uncharacterized protein n=1 Tax=Mucilaginibacter aquatilis TaxID=1517760 RepID=A0A6I4I8K7_9SPHI|nr:hypothetical protein [Mucilaginibacter aquatilis]MVN91461.1 hypothetical protein [Mucilaginibacter aquatilis]
MITEIKDLQDVAAFMHCLIEESVNAHPDDSFSDYVHIDTGLPTYTNEEAALRNRLMEQAFEVCEGNHADIYSVMQEIFLKETGLDTFIPLPSAVIPDSGI